MHTMALSKLRSKFKKSSATPEADAPALVETPPATEAATAIEAKVELSPPAPDTKEAESAAGSTPPAEPPRGSRLVEGERTPEPAIDFLAAARKRGRKLVKATRPAHKPVAAAAAIALAAGLGFMAGKEGGSRPVAQLALVPAGPDVRQLDGELTRLSSEVQLMKASLTTNERARDIAPKQAQQIERLERSGQDQAGKISRLTESLERVERAQRETTKLSALAERIDRMEKSMAAPASTAAVAPPAVPVPPTAAPPPVVAAVTPPPKPTTVAATAPEVEKTGSIESRSAKVDVAKQETDPRRIQLDGFVVRDVDDGYALIESRTGRFFEVAAGQTLSGIGRVESVERRGRQWVVVTAKGYIGERWN